MERFVERHAAGELFGDRQVEAAGVVGLDCAGAAAAHDSHVVADCHRAAIRSPEHDLLRVVQEASLLEERGEPRAAPAGSANATEEEIR